MMQIKCRKCGKVFPYEDIICPKCGYDITEDENVPIRDAAFVRQLKKMKEERAKNPDGSLQVQHVEEEEKDSKDKEKKLMNTIRLMAVAIIFLLIAVVSLMLMR